MNATTETLTLENHEPPARVTSGGIPSGDSLGSVFLKGEARSVNFGTDKKPCWVIEGPTRTAEDIAWTRSIVDALHPVRTTDAGVVSGDKINPDETK